MNRPQWCKTLGNGITRATGVDGIVTIRPAYDGGYRVTVSRCQDGIYYPTHSRTFK